MKRALHRRDHDTEETTATTIRMPRLKNPAFFAMAGVNQPNEIRCNSYRTPGLDGASSI